MKGFCLVLIILGLNTFSAFCQKTLIKSKRGTQLDSLLEKAYYLDSISLDSAFVANKFINRFPIDSLLKLKIDESLFEMEGIEGFGYSPKSFSKELNTSDFSSYFNDEYSFENIEKDLFSEIGESIHGGVSDLEGKENFVGISKRVVSIKDREILDSIRGIASDKLYRIKDEVQDSVGLYLISEKKKLKESLFFEGIVNVEDYKGDYSVSDFSSSLGVKLNQFYEVGAGPEIGLQGKALSTFGARVFARRNLFKNKAFAIVENSFTNYPDLTREVDSFNGLTSNLKLGAGKLFNLTQSGKTKLNVQTLIHPDFLRNNYSNLIDFRFGISKMSFK